MASPDGRRRPTSARRRRRRKEPRMAYRTGRRERIDDRVQGGGGKRWIRRLLRLRAWLALPSATARRRGVHARRWRLCRWRCNQCGWRGRWRRGLHQRGLAQLEHRRHRRAGPSPARRAVVRAAQHPLRAARLPASARSLRSLREQATASEGGWPVGGRPAADRGEARWRRATSYRVRGHPSDGDVSNETASDTSAGRFLDGIDGAQVGASELWQVVQRRGGLARGGA
mmetsp:Transcript_30194/g.100890  ORF Transcript_30194/g.100890 Transcript_30194/m.100890 type:complete len:228 (-) Transcript_30194:418-1101(-)